MMNDNDTDISMILGWQPSPNGRGTLDLVYSCLLTIFLCTWSVLCVNVPARGDGIWQILSRKVMFAALGLLGPEFIVQAALGQWISAKQSVKLFRGSGYHEWSIKHAFFADMGGFMLHTPDFPLFPIDAKQTHYLVANKHILYPQVTKKDIEDRDKVDLLLRIIVVCQISWFVVNCVARGVQGLALTTLELSTISFTFCTFGTEVFWLHKPADVLTPIIIHCDVSISNILQLAGNAAREPYNHTPLDFVNRKEWTWTLAWNFLRNKLRLAGVHLRPAARPMPRIPNDNWLEVPTPTIYVLIVFDMAYAAIYLSGWNLWFPSHVERVLWRAATLSTMASIFLFLVVEALSSRLTPHLKRRYGFPKHGPSESRPHRWLPAWLHNVLKWIRNSSPNKDPNYYIPLKIVLRLSSAAIVYCLARTYILVECLLALRRLPASAYETVEWSRYWPHY
jgi:hypothetical protein